MRYGSPLTSFVLVLLASKAFAWGARGHEIVSSVGADLIGESSEPFWLSNAENMRQLSTVPDRVWKSPRTKADEGPTHFFQADAYVKEIERCEDILQFPKSYDDAVQKYGDSAIAKNGTAIFRVVQMYDMALTSFRKGDTAAGIEQAGAMSHYIGDLAMPLHVSENYDGKETGNSGIHSYFETKIVGNAASVEADVAERAALLLKDPAFLQQSTGDVADILNHEVIRSLEKRDEILKNDSKYGRKGAKGVKIQLALAEDRMADGAATLAIILGKLSREAGLTRLSSEIPIKDPEWIEPDYGSQHFHQMFTPLNGAAPGAELEDDCGATI